MLKKCSTEAIKVNYLEKLKKSMRMESKIADESIDKIEELKNEVLTGEKNI